MPPRSKVALLPEEVRRALEQRLVDNAFSGYEALAQWLTEQGYEIGKSAVHAYGQDLQRQLEAVRASTQAAAAIAEAAPDEADERSAAVMSLVQTNIFQVLVKLQELDAEDDPAARLKILGKAAEGIATLSRASVNQKKWKAEVATRVQAAASAAEKIAKKGGLSEQAASEIRREILGIAA